MFTELGGLDIWYASFWAALLVSSGSTLAVGLGILGLAGVASGANHFGTVSFRLRIL